MSRFTGFISVALILCISTVLWAQEKRLDYRQQQSLKDASYYLDQAEGIAKALDEKIKDWKAGDASIQLGTVQNYIASKDKAVQYLKNADDRFKQLPATHSQVKPELDRLRPVQDSLGASEKKLNEVLAGLQGVVAQGTGAGYKADFDRLKEINQMYGNPQVIQSQAEVAIDVIKQMGAVKTERQRISDTYADLLKQSTGEANNMKGVLRHFDDVFGRFEKSLTQFVTSAPAAIEKDIDEALKMGQDAVANKRHLYFGEQGGVSQRLSWAATKLSILEAAVPDSADATAAKKKLDDARQQVIKMREALVDDIVQSNSPPAESYNGPDKAALIDLVKTKWASSGVAGDVLKIGINSKDWRRDTRWEWFAGAWHKVDKSKVQGYVIVKSGDTLAAMYHMNLVKDHQANDQIEAFFFHDPKQPPDVSQKLPLGKVK